VSTPAKQYDEALVNFYEEQLVSHADTAYRFAFALTLSLDGAAKCTKKTFQQLSANLEKAHGAGDANTTLLLIAETWKTVQELKGQKFSEGQSAVTKVLKPLSLEARAALASVDVAGLLPSDAARALGWAEKDLRTHLAKARKALMASTLDV
jgi:hypothetical protein